MQDEKQHNPAQHSKAMFARCLFQQEPDCLTLEHWILLAKILFDPQKAVLWTWHLLRCRLPCPKRKKLQSMHFTKRGVNIVNFNFPLISEVCVDVKPKPTNYYQTDLSVISPVF